MSADGHGGGPSGSVVIPAHDEAAVIGRTLSALRRGMDPTDLQVVVVCNGCTDATAAVARTFPDVEVVEIAEASKIAALREGDRRIEVFPRIYLDGDIALDGRAALAILARLDTEEPRVAGVLGRYDLSSARRPVRWYYTFRQELPVFRDGIIGAGVYAMNRAGRARLGEWPEVLGDDQFVLRSFAPAERLLVADHHTVVSVAPDLRSVVRRGLRVRRGNRELTDRFVEGSLSAPRTGVGWALRRSLLRPRLWPGAVTWLTVTVLIRVLDRVGAGSGDWGSDRRAGRAASGS